MAAAKKMKRDMKFSDRVFVLYPESVIQPTYVERD
jgi:hypothetical protein